MNPDAATNFMLVAGERSGDVYGGRLASALKVQRAGLELWGCGGDSMRHAGVETKVDLKEFAMVGITEVAGGLPRAIRAYDRLLSQARARRPALAILIDSPSLNMRLARRLKRLGIPVLYFVSPQVWAWKRWRLGQLRGRIDKMACIFDFEESLYQRAGIPAEYVGHPLADSVRPHQTREAFFSSARLDPSLPTIALLPGSRSIEIRYILPALAEAAAMLARGRKVQFVLVVAPTLAPSQVESWFRSAPDHGLKVGGAVRILPQGPQGPHAAYDALAYSTMAIVASGTATVEAALLGCPMVVVYRVSPVTAFLAKWMVRVPFYSMVNILAGKSVVPELIQKDFTARRLTSAVEFILDHPEVQLRMRDEFKAIKSRLGRGGAIERVAGLALKMALNSTGSLPEG
jgi:lipid-A-disaccharide synthase